MLVDAYGSVKLAGSRYSSDAWYVARATRLLCATSFSFVAVCMKACWKGLKNIMGTITQKAYCFHLEVVLAYLGELEVG